MSGIQFPNAVRDALVRSGLVKESEVQTVTVHAPAVAYDATQAAAPGFVPPPWYERLRFAMKASSQRGATLFGPRGAGKTTAVHMLSKQDGTELVTYQAASGCTIDDLVGVRDLKDGKTVFTDGPLPDAIRKDCWLLIEEANVMHPGVFSKLNTLTDGSGDTLRLPDGTRLVVGPKFRVVLAFNEGAAYSGTREVNAALRDRLMPIYADYLPEKSEVGILVQRTGCDEATAKRLVGFAKQIRAARANLGFDLSPRALLRMLDMIRFLGESWKSAFEYGILDLIGDPIDKKVQRDAIQKVAEAAGLFSWSLPRFVPPGSVLQKIEAKNGTCTVCGGIGTRPSEAGFNVLCQACNGSGKAKP